ncbi:Rho guanine nucleotide exchange factor 26 [Sarracenia purpurea var. burkii]
MKKARKTVRKSWSSFNQQMRRSSANANNVVASASSLNKDDYGGDGDAAGLRWSENDARTKVASGSGRPSSPPPPPPIIGIGKRQCADLSSCSDLRLRFADEPLYQFYAESVAQATRRYYNMYGGTGVWMPLLVDAILSKLDPVDDQSDHRAFKITLAKLNKIVKDCNENARKFERYEEMLLVSRQLEFSRKDVKMFSVASSSRWLVRSGPLMYLNPPDAKLTITRKLTKNAIKLYFFLFNDILVIAKKKR